MVLAEEDARRRYRTFEELAREENTPAPPTTGHAAH
jgi:hypothetical protein